VADDLDFSPKTSTRIRAQEQADELAKTAEERRRSKQIDKEQEALIRRKEAVESPTLKSRATSWLGARGEKLKGGMKQVGESLKETARQRIDEDVYGNRPPRRRAPAAPRRQRAPPRRSRAPVPGGRPRRPWIPSRRAPAPGPDDIVGDLVSHGGEYLDMGVGDLGFGGMGGGIGVDIDDIMDAGSNLLYGAAPRRRKGKKRR